jgi:hypothetical protein
MILPKNLSFYLESLPKRTVRLILISPASQDEYRKCNLNSSRPLLYLCLITIHHFFQRYILTKPKPRLITLYCRSANSVNGRLKLHFVASMAKLQLIRQTTSNESYVYGTEVG